MFVFVVEKGALSKKNVQSLLLLVLVVVIFPPGGLLPFRWGRCGGFFVGFVLNNLKICFEQFLKIFRWYGVLAS